jgi:homoserine dehydrogenase
MNPLRIAIIGLGTVGAGVLKILQEQAETLALRASRAIVVTAVSARDKNKDRGVDISSLRWLKNPLEATTADDVDVVIELIGGAEGEAKELVTNALKNKKSVITANKALLAKHGMMLADLAEKNHQTLAYEAAVAGGIPVIKLLRESLSGNKIHRISGILNGTCNYILSTMQKTGRSLEDVLQEAQKLGYAEADPSTDIDGPDTAHKLALLTTLSFGIAPSLASISMQGIRHIRLKDIRHAEQLGYQIKLLGIAKKQDEQIIQQVHPALIKNDHPLARVMDVFNAICIESEPLGRLFIEGRGAGQGPTASAVIADIIDLAAGRKNQIFSAPSKSLNMASDDYSSTAPAEHYLCLDVIDKAGVLATISDIWKRYGISMESIVQNPSRVDEETSIFGITHPITPDTHASWLKAAQAETGIIKHVQAIRVERDNKI